MMKFLFNVILVITTAYLGLCTIMFLLQNQMLYFPTQESHSSDAEVIWLNSSGERLKIWHVSRPGTRAILYFGGNAEDVSGNIRWFSSLFPDHSLYLMNYRGFGGSSGKPSEQGILADAEALFAHASSTNQEISIIGRSLGTGVAIHLGASQNVDRLVLITPYDSMVQVASTHYPYVPVKLLLRDKYDSLSKVGQVSAETLLLIAEEDKVIPYRHSEQLQNGFRPGLVVAHIIPDTDHNTIGLSPLFDEHITSFINSPQGSDKTR